MQSIETKIINWNYGKGRGWAFFKNGFVDLGGASAIGRLLSRLVSSPNQTVTRPGFLGKFCKLRFQTFPKKDSVPNGG